MAPAETSRQFVRGVWNDRNFEAIPEYMTEDCMVYDPTYPEPIRGHDAYREYVRDIVGAFPDFRGEHHVVLEDGNRVMTHFTVSGTNTGSFGPLPPTGRRVEIDGMSLIRFEDGRIAEERVFLDSREFRRQLGLSFPAILRLLPRLAYRALRARL
jgi:steroid delta-isomerase-like uncharacterized protein